MTAEAMIAVTALLLAGCVGCAASPAAADPAADPCSPAALGLGSAKALAAYAKPDACEQLISDGHAVIDAQKTYDTYLRCAKDTKVNVDWTKQALVFDAWMMSPAAAGLDAYDDGKVITLVTRDRSPCPNDPHAMPITLPKYFVTTHGGVKRTFASASCTMPPRCK